MIVAMEAVYMVDHLAGTGCYPSAIGCFVGYDEDRDGGCLDGWADYCDEVWNEG